MGLFPPDSSTENIDVNLDEQQLDFILKNISQTTQRGNWRWTFSTCIQTSNRCMYDTVILNGENTFKHSLCATLEVLKQ